MESVLEKLQKQDERLRNIESLLSIQKNVLNIDEVCTLTGLSKSCVYKKTCYQNGMPFYKQAGRLFFDRLEIEKWLKTNRFQSVEELDKEAATYITLKKEGDKNENR